MSEEQESVFISHVPCPSCGSSDANSEYSDGHTHCFACNHHTGPTGEGTAASPKRAEGLLPFGQVTGLHTRKITEETCRHFGYSITERKGKPVQCAPYYDRDGVQVAQHLRTKDKNFPWVGEPKTALPFGAHAWQKTGKLLVVTEGEVDALSMSQAQGNKWPVVSIGCGAGPQVKKYIAERLDYFKGFEKIVLMLDNDGPGRQAAKDAAEVLGVRAHIAELPLKDANEMLVAGRTADLIDAMWKAKQYRPDGIVEIGSLEDEVMKDPEWGLSYPWQALTEWTYGIRLHELIALGAGVGSGKTDVFTEIIAHLTQVHKQHAGIFYMEQKNAESALRIAGKVASKTFHIPGSGWTMEDKTAAWSKMKDGGKIYLYDSFGNNEWESLEEKIEYLHHACDVQYFFIDHLTALAAHQDDEKHTLEVIMSAMGGLVQRLPITIFFISHLTTPDSKSKPHEEGGRVMAKHLKGSRSIIQWASFILGLERNQQAADPEQRNHSILRCLKDRFTGAASGKTVGLYYDAPTGRLNEGDTPQFDDETDDDSGTSRF